MMYKLLLLLTLAFTLSLFVNAQNKTSVTCTVKGILLDSLSNEGEPYATIRIVEKLSPDSPVKMAVTDIKGKFQEKLNVYPGKYVITISSVGKNSVSKEFEIKPGNFMIDLGNLYTAEATEQLSGIEVIAQKPLVRVDMDKIEYNIQDDPDSKTNNVLEMLRKVPMVTVDGEDKIQVNGSSNFKIHVNGKPNNMMSNNPKEVLKSMPANTIKYIEVITEPGAKYDAEGVGGILNIVTVGSGMQGYTATFNATASNCSAEAGGYATVQLGKFTVTGNYNYNHDYLNLPKNYSDNYRESFVDNENKYLVTRGNSRNSNNFQYGNLEGSYEIDTFRLISFSANIYGWGDEGRGVSSTDMQNVNNEHVYSYNSSNKTSFSSKYIGANMDYQRSFKKKGELLTFSYRFNNTPQRNEYSVDYYNVLDYPYASTLTDNYSSNKATTIEHTLQLDYANPLTENQEIEVGGKYIIRNSKSDSKYYDIKNGYREEDLEKSNRYDHLQDILAAYAGYRIKIKKFGVKAGVRYEHTFMKIKYRMDDWGDGIKRPDFSSNFDDVVPSLTFSYQLGQLQTLRASYNMRISRPGIWYLNPYVDRNNPDNISYGNPDLDSEKSHSFSIKFSSFTQKFNIDLGLSHRFVNNSIERYSFIGKDEETGREGVMQSTYKNMGKLNNTRLSVYINWNIGSKTRFYMNGGVDYSDYKSRIDDLSNHGFSYNCYGGIQHTLPWNLRLSLNAGGSSGNVNLQGDRSGFYYYAIGLNRSFLKDRFTISLRTSNPFEKYRTFKSNINSDTFLSKNKSKYNSRYIGINFSYRIGELTARVKKAERSIQNDDVKSGDNNNGNRAD